MNRFSNRSKENGSAITEMIFSVSTLILLFGGGLSLSYLVFARFWIERASYEALICLSTSAPTVHCEREFRQSIATALPLGLISNLRILRAEKSAEIDVRFQLGRKNVVHHHARKRLPLIESKASRHG